MKIVPIVIAMGLSLRAVSAGTPEYGYHVIRAYPHDPQAFTEGLFYLNGFLYESTGLQGHSSVRKVELETGKIVQQRQLPASYFGEGIVNWRDRVYQLTWLNHTGFVYDLDTFALRNEFHYPGEGWALTQNGSSIIMDDGTPQIRFWDPETLTEVRRIIVTDRGEPVNNLNELEWVEGEIFANVWGTNRIARIDPASGAVAGWIDLTGLLSSPDQAGSPEAVLNGIAYDAQQKRLFVTGKHWPKLFQIQLIPRAKPQ